MLDTSTFETRFNEWRKNAAKKEQYSLQIATFIAEFVNNSNLKGIQDNLKTKDSETFLKFNLYSPEEERGLAGLYGLLFYLKLAIDDYKTPQDGHATLSSDELKNLNDSLENINNLYQNPLWFPGRKLDALQSNINRWLTKHAPQSPNATKANELCLSFYTALKTINLNFDAILPQYKSAVDYAIGIEMRQGQITELLNITEEQIKKFTPPQIEEERVENAMQGPLVAPSVAEVEEEEFFECSDGSEPNQDDALLDADESPITVADISSDDVSSTFDDICDDQSVAILTTTGLSIKAKVEQLKLSLDLTYQRLTQLIEKKKQVNALELDYSNVQAIEGACKEDRNASDIVKENVQTYRLLLELYPDQAETLTPKLEQLDNQGISETVVFVVKGLFTQNTTPSIGDECKEALQKLAHTHIEALRGQFNADGTRRSDGELDRLERDIEEITSLLADGHSAVKSSLKNTSIAILEQSLLPTNRSKQGVIVMYEGLVNTILEHRNKLKKLEGLDQTVDAFIATYDSFLVTISLFLARYLGSFFKTNTADKIEQARSMKDQISQFKNGFEAVCQTSLDAIKNNKEISQSIKNELATQLNLPMNDDEPPEPMTSPGEAIPLEARAVSPDEPSAPVTEAEVTPVVPPRKIDSEFAEILKRFRFFSPVQPPEQPNSPPSRSIVI